ncbi:hypothetical protein BB559_004628 [Furculomyces boomerangus]|uniref:Uncharacterized protein n=1 Tax=Furculomyces boomerangus TaxID=61424 RepID=A0A2T9YDN3_9FUNG|nr:hypothetical protein BB559_004628 [Furculomyces boomerangus]
MFKNTLDKLGIRNTIILDKEPRPKNVRRIEYLAKVRNKTLEPLEIESLNGHKYEKIVSMMKTIWKLRFEIFGGAALLNTQPFCETIKLRFRRIVTVPRILPPYELECLKLLDDHYRLDPVPPPKEEKINMLVQKQYGIQILDNNKRDPDEPIIQVKYTDDGTKVT